MAHGLEKGQCSKQDLHNCLASVPKALEPYVLGRYLAVTFTIMTCTADLSLWCWPKQDLHNCLACIPKTLKPYVLGRCPFDSYKVL